LSDKYKIFETDEFIKDLKKIDNPNQRKIYGKIIKSIYPQIKMSPYVGRNIKKLKDYKPETWRYRIGDFRLFYEINDKDKIINIITIEHRSKAY
jgi:mRNA interferase RelE/StbE